MHNPIQITQKEFIDVVHDLGDGCWTLYCLMANLADNGRCQSMQSAEYQQDCFV